MHGLLETELIIVLLLLVISIVAVAMRLIRIPYTVALVLVGLALAFQGGIELHLTQEIILLVFLPPLIFEAAFHLNFSKLRNNLPLILILAIPGVLVVTFIVGGVMIWGAGLSIGTALVFGALIAATDPVAVVAIFKELGAPKRLATIVEGESLLNDGTAIVVFNIILGAALTGTFDITEGILDFFIVSGGGLLIGLIFGWGVARIIASIDDHLVETTLTTVLAYGAYLVAEQFHVSGVLAVVAAGILNGNIGPKGMSATTKIVLFSFWEYLAFIANSLIFLLIGLEINLSLLQAYWGLIILAGGGLLVGRALTIYGFTWLSRFFKSGPVPIRWQHLLSWGGLKGAVSLALALGLPSAIGSDRDLILSLTFGVVLFTLLVQAPTMSPLIKLLKIVKPNRARVAYQTQMSELMSLKAAQNRLDELFKSGVIPELAMESLLPDLEKQTHTIAASLETLMEDEPSVHHDILTTTRRELLITQRGTMHTLHRDGAISDGVFETLIHRIDTLLDELDEH